MIRVGAAILAMATACAASAQELKPRMEKLSPRPVHREPLASEITGSKPYVYSRWMKFCGKDTNNPAAKTVCITMKEARLETGQFVAGAALIESTGDPKKLRVTLPLGLQWTPGARVFIDNDTPRSGPYTGCYPNGCMADFEVSADFIAQLKSGGLLHIEGTNAEGGIASHRLPLGDFAAASDGPPTDMQAFEAEQRRKRDEACRAGGCAARLPPNTGR